MGLLGLPFFFFLPELFPWARPGAGLDPVLAHRAPYLNAPFLLVRYLLFFALFSWVLLKLKPGEHRAEVGAWGLPLVFAAATFLSFDLFKSLEAHFYSASYGPILLLSAVVLALAVSVALAARRGTAALLGQAQNHTNLLLALSIVWIYLEATTLIIVWGADFPHEVEFYLKRLQGPWDGVAALWVVGGFFLPFLYLLTNSPNGRPATFFPSPFGWPSSAWCTCLVPPPRSGPGGWGWGRSWAFWGSASSSPPACGDRGICTYLHERPGCTLEVGVHGTCTREVADGQGSGFGRRFRRPGGGQQGEAASGEGGGGHPGGPEHPPRVHARLPLGAFGMREPEEIRRPLANLEKRGIQYLQATVEALDPAHNKVKTSAGELAYDYLIVSLGAEAMPSPAQDGHAPWSMAGA